MVDGGHELIQPWILDSTYYRSFARRRMKMEKGFLKQRVGDPRKIATAIIVLFLAVSVSWMFVPDELFSWFAICGQLHAEVRTIRYLSLILVVGATVCGPMLGWASAFAYERSERNRAERLEKSWRRRFEVLFDNTLDGVLLMDRDGQVIESNRCVNMMFLSAPEDHCIGENIATVCPWAGNREGPGGRHAREFTGQFMLQRTNGTHFVADISWIPFEDEEAQEMTLVFVREISERIPADGSSQAAEEFSRKIIATFPDLFLRTDLDGNILFVNDAALLLLPREKILGRNVLSFVAPEEQCIARRNLSLRLEGPLGPHEYTLVLDGGIRLDCEVTGDILKGLDCTSLGRAYIVHDVSGRKRAADQSSESCAGKKVLLRDVHHHILNNLQVVSSLLNLQASRVKDATLRACFTDSQSRIRSIALVHELLYNDNSSGFMDILTYCRELTDHLMSIYRNARVEIQPQGPSFSLGLDQAVPCGLILCELISKAIKTVYPGSVRIGISSIDEEACISVSDDCADGLRDMDGADSDSFGMLIVGSLTDQLGGTLTMKSDVGTEFTLRFPLAGHCQRTPLRTY